MTKKTIVILVHALVGWAACAATMGIGMSTTTLTNTLIIHAIVAPVGFGLISLFYFKKFHYTSPIVTAIVFVAFVIAVDFFIVALLMQKSLEMFTSLLGTWIPFILIFASTYVTGLYAKKPG